MPNQHTYYSNILKDFLNFFKANIFAQPVEVTTTAKATAKDKEEDVIVETPDEESSSS